MVVKRVRYKFVRFNLILGWFFMIIDIFKIFMLGLFLLVRKWRVKNIFILGLEK